jgi:hypothetical protein
LAFFPAMGMPHEQKLELVGTFLDMMADSFHIGPMRECAERLTDLAIREPNFLTGPSGTSASSHQTPAMGVQVHG